MYRLYVKRALDVALALLMALVLWPLMLLIALAICIEDPHGGPFFIQERVGYNEKLFKMYKFRSMRLGAHRAGDDAKRLLRVGNILRKTSLDELPQIINILKNEMSFIGPRPLYADYLPYYTDRERLRHSVLPGISGLAQVSGRNNATWEQRFEFDVQYVEEMSFALDLNILIKTFVNVFTAKDVSLAQLGSLQDFDVYRSNSASA